MVRLLSAWSQPRMSFAVMAATCLAWAYGSRSWAEEPAAPGVKPNEIVDAPYPAEEAARTMIVPEGFRVTLFAGEPDVQQPIGMCTDDRGRIWVAEAYNYPNHGTKPGDRIVILADTDGDGRSDQRTVFFDQLNYVTGIEVGFGGAWVMSPPYFYFIPDRDGDDRPDGPPEVLLDGFGNHANAHNLANGFAWGPDGWLYGTHGRTNWSLLGRPGTPKEQRLIFDGGVYRYHPLRHVWEAYADGATNPWGIDWNDYGEAFVCNCVNPHLFHVIYGAHYEPWRNRESSRYAYQRIPTIADHLHFVGGNNIRGGFGLPEEDAAGGGHAHCGTMVYLGDNWPNQYRNTLFTNNIHGRRINNDLLARHGSGYVASHGKDLLRARDPWFMGVTLLYGPDGSVFVSDWSDTGECHSTKNTRRETGRIFNIRYGKPDRRPVNLAKLTDSELVALQLHRNEWFVRHARRLLQERAAQQDMSKSVQQLRNMFAEEQDIPRKLRALWALHAVGAASDDFLVAQLRHEHDSIRTWAARLLCDDGDPPVAALAQFATMATNDSSSYQRMILASLLQRIQPAERWPIAQALLRHPEDDGDDNIPLMLWYGVEPLVHENVERFLALASESRLPLVSRFAARRVASLTKNSAALEALVQRLGTTTGATQSALLAGTREGLEGRRTVSKPANWPEAFRKLQDHSDEDVLEQSLQLALVFDDPAALTALRTQATSPNVSPTIRQRAIASLVAKQADDTAPLLLQLLDDAMVRRAAIRGLAEFDAPTTAETLLGHYGEFDAEARQDAVQTLAARSAWALRLMDAVETHRVPRTDVTAYAARQMLSLKNPQLSARIEAAWGQLRSTPIEKQRLIAGYRRQLSPEALRQADRSQGRAVFEKTCAKCHRFFDAGGAIGPNITGSQRTNLDYLLETIVDPSAAVARDYQFHLIETTGGRVISGLLVSESESAVTVQAVNEKIVVPTVEIDSRTVSSVSMMPEGILATLTSDEIRSLFAYLMGPNQAPLPTDAARPQGVKQE